MEEERGNHVLMNRSSDVLQVLLETCIMQFISLNTNNYALEYKTSEVKARLWMLQMEHGAGSRETCLSSAGLPLTCCMSSGMSLTAQSCNGVWALLCWALQHQNDMMFSQTSPDGLAEADPHSQHLSPTSASGLCLWQGWWRLHCRWSFKQR